MEQINKVELQGNVGTVRINEVGDNKVARFSLATNHAYKSKEGDVIETTWHNIVAWSNKSMPDFEKIRKGTCLNITGRIKVSKYTANDGTDKQLHEIIANKIVFVTE